MAASALPALVAALALDPGSDLSGRLQLAVFVGLVSLAVVALVRAKIRHEPLRSVRQRVLGGAGDIPSRGDWIMGIAFGGLGPAAVTAVAALAAPRRRRVASAHGLIADC